MIHKNNKLSTLIKTIKKLRDIDNGCPWNLKQTHKSLKTYLIEEAYEVTDALSYGTKDEIVEELGDLLYQILLHTEIGREQKKFSLEEVINKLVIKLIRRHPHVFNRERVSELSTDKYNQWNDIKSIEKGVNNSLIQRLKLKKRAQPTIKASISISNEMSKHGFKWQSNEHIWNKFNEEILEFKEALVKKDNKNMEEELGDILFTLINFINNIGFDPENCLDISNEKIINRISFIQNNIQGELKNQSTKTLKNLWDKAKKHKYNNKSNCQENCK